MKRKTSAKANRSDRLEEAVTVLIQSMAPLTQNQVAFLARGSEMDRINSERLGRIEERLERLEQNMKIVLQMLEAMPEVIRQKIGFKPADEGPRLLGDASESLSSFHLRFLWAPEGLPTLAGGETTGPEPRRGSRPGRATDPLLQRPSRARRGIGIPPGGLATGYSPSLLRSETVRGQLMRKSL